MSEQIPSAEERDRQWSAFFTSIGRPDVVQTKPNATVEQSPEVALPDSLDDLNTEQIADLARTHPAHFLSIAKPKLDRMTIAEKHALRLKDPKGYLAAIREKYSAGEDAV